MIQLVLVPRYTGHLCATGMVFYNCYSALHSSCRFINPCVVLIHGPDLPHGPYWEYFLQISPNIVHVYRERPTHVFKNQLRFKEHSSDVMRIEALIGERAQLNFISFLTILLLIYSCFHFRFGLYSFIFSLH